MHGTNPIYEIFSSIDVAIGGSIHKIVIPFQGLRIFASVATWASSCQSNSKEGLM